MLKEVGCGSITPPPGDSGEANNRQVGANEGGGGGSGGGGNGGGGGGISGTEGPLGCGGCGREIAERWYLQAAERAWHCDCLRCCHCRVPLATQTSCYARDGNIYCKEDYYRSVQCKTDGGCGMKGWNCSDVAHRTASHVQRFLWIGFNWYSAKLEKHFKWRNYARVEEILLLLFFLKNLYTYAWRTKYASFIRILIFFSYPRYFYSTSLCFRKAKIWSHGRMRRMIQRMQISNARPTSFFVFIFIGTALDLHRSVNPLFSSACQDAFLAKLFRPHKMSINSRCHAHEPNRYSGIGPWIPHSGDVLADKECK